MNYRLLSAAAVALMLASGAQADAIVGDIAAVQPKSASAASTASGSKYYAYDKAAQKAAKQDAKAAKRAAKVEKRATKRLTKQCRQEQKRLAKKGIPLSSACMPAPATVADVKADPTPSANNGSPTNSGAPVGNALGQTGTSNQQGAQGNGNAYGYGQGGNNVVTSTLPPAAYQPVSGPVTLQTVSPTNGAVAVPEPATLSLLGLGLLGLGAVGRRRKAA